MSKHPYLTPPIKTLLINTSLSDRVEHIRCLLGYPMSEFAELLDVDEIMLKKMLSGNTGVGLNIILKIIFKLQEVFPIINDQWLLVAGTGKVFKNDSYISYCYGSDSDVDIALRLQQVRQMHDLSLEEMAEKIGSTKYIVTNIENLRSPMTVPFMRRVIKTFKLDTDWFVWGRGLVPQPKRKKNYKETLDV